MRPPEAREAASGVHVAGVGAAHHHHYQFSDVKIMGKTTSLRVALLAYTRCATALRHSVCRSTTFLSCSTAHTTVRAVARFRQRRTEACAPLTESGELRYGSRSCGAQLRNWCRQVAQLDLVALWLVTPAAAAIRQALLFRPKS